MNSDTYIKQQIENIEVEEEYLIDIPILMTPRNDMEQLNRVGYEISNNIDMTEYSKSGMLEILQKEYEEKINTNMFF